MFTTLVYYTYTPDTVFFLNVAATFHLLTPSLPLSLLLSLHSLLSLPVMLLHY